MRIALVLYVHKFGRQGARNVSDDTGYVENSALPTPKFGH